MQHAKWGANFTKRRQQSDVGNNLTFSDKYGGIQKIDCYSYCTGIPMNPLVYMNVYCVKMNTNTSFMNWVANCLAEYELYPEDML